MPAPRFDTVVINGSVGTGKTTTAETLGEELDRRDIPGAVIDVDWLRRSWPAPHGDPFQVTLALANVRAIASNFRDAGAVVLVVATVVETPDELRRTEAALSAARLLHVRLTAAHDVVLARLARRHADDDAVRRWHEHRHPELADILAGAGFTDELLIDTTARTPADVAQGIAATVMG